MKQKLKQLLTSTPLARERKYRYHTIRKLLKETYPQLKEIPKETMLQICRDVLNLDRTIRQVQQENPNLQGKDYQDKHELEAIKQQELGYATEKSI